MNNDLDTLIKALQIFRKYGNPTYPIQCEHDIMYVLVPDRSVSAEDKKQLAHYGFFGGSEDPSVFYSNRFGSA